MKWFLNLWIAVVVFLVWGCSSPQPPPKPTPDLQAKIQAMNEMGSWFTEIRYSTGLCNDAIAIIRQKLVEIENGADRGKLARIIAYFNEPGSLVERLKSNQEEIHKIQVKLEGIKEKDFSLFRSLSDLARIHSEMVPLVATLPEIPAEFMKKTEDLSNQYSVIEKLMLRSFPQSDADLAQRKTPENPEYKRDQRILHNLPAPLPKQMPVASPSPEAQETAVPTPALVKVWRDSKGVLHVGQAPPENAKTRDIQGSISQGFTSEKPKEQPEESELPASGSSLIWKDKDGNVHMGAKAPEGVKVKKAEDIDMMISK